MATEAAGTTRANDRGSWTLLCGRDECIEVSRHTVEITIGKWTSIVGACDEHREDLGLFALRLKEAASR
jgi:hypothetical protein